MSHKLVSVIIPNFNSIQFIEETLNSVFNQTYKHIEIIVVDDGSDDGSYDYISNLNKDNVRLFKNPTKGACAARNYGISKATGFYIQFLDSDDLIDLDKIEKQVKDLNASKNKVAVCSTKHFQKTSSEGVITDIEFMFSTDQPEEFLLNLYGANGLNHNMVAQHAWLVPKEVIDKAGKWDENLIKDQDGEYFCRVITASDGIIFQKDVLCYYRKHRKAGNISSGKSEHHLLSQFNALNSKSKQFKSVNTPSYRTAMALQYKIIAVDAYPTYMEIYTKAMEKVDEFGGSTYEPLLGGNIIEMIKSIFGWRNAKAFSVFVHKYFMK